MGKPRDYKAEYQRRIARGLAKGFSRAEARGHSNKPLLGYDDHLEQALKLMRDKHFSAVQAAQAKGVSLEKLRRYLKQSWPDESGNRHLIAQKQGGKWIIYDDFRLRKMQILSQGKTKEVTVRGILEARKVGTYSNAIKQFLVTNNRAYLEPFENVFVTDIHGKKYKLETNPNTLYRLASSSHESFEEVYRIVS